MSEGFYDDPERLDFPTADRLVREYIQHKHREQTTSVHVLRWSDYPNDHHNRHRVHESLKQYANETEADWAGRTVFDLPGTTPNP